MVLKSRRFREITASVLCVASAVRGCYDLKRGAPFGLEIATMGLVWAFAYAWLSGRWPDPRRPRRRDTPLEAVMSWGLWAFFLALVLWIASGA
jgi:hypothetical protein